MHLPYCDSVSTSKQVKPSSSALTHERYTWDSVGWAAIRVFTIMSPMRSHTALQKQTDDMKKTNTLFFASENKYFWSPIQDAQS